MAIVRRSISDIYSLSRSMLSSVALPAASRYLHANLARGGAPILRFLAKMRIPSSLVGTLEQDTLIERLAINKSVDKKTWQPVCSARLTDVQRAEKIRDSRSISIRQRRADIHSTDFRPSPKNFPCKQGVQPDAAVE